MTEIGWPRRAYCVRPGCGHSSDVHVFLPKGNEGISVTASACAFPCYEDGCECGSMVRSIDNYRELMEQVNCD